MGHSIVFHISHFQLRFSINYTKGASVKLVIEPCIQNMSSKKKKRPEEEFAKHLWGKPKNQTGGKTIGLYLGILRRIGIICDSYCFTSMLTPCQLFFFCGWGWICESNVGRPHPTPSIDCVICKPPYPSGFYSVTEQRDRRWLHR